MTNETLNVWIFVVRVLTFLAVTIGLFLTFKQLRANARQKAAEFVTTAQESLFANERSLQMYYLIEYGDFTYTQDFHKSPFEKPLDELLYQLENLARIYRSNHLNIADLGHFAYRYLVVYQDSEVQKYFATLDDWYEKRGLTVRPFSAFRDVGQIIERKYYMKIYDEDRVRKLLEKIKPQD